MATERRQIANQANARHSTGPKTPEGKAAVRLNAFRHGLLARDVVLPGEDADAFEELWNQVRANLSPVGPIEEFLADEIVNAMWRLRRLARAETALFNSRMHEIKANQLAIKVRSYERDFSLPVAILDKAAHAEASEALQRAKYEKERDEVLVGRALAVDAKQGDAFAKLARYERSLERSFHRNLDRLLHIQDKRRSRSSSPTLDAITPDTEDTE